MPFDRKASQQALELVLDQLDAAPMQASRSLPWRPAYDAQAVEGLKARVRRSLKDDPWLTGMAMELPRARAFRMGVLASDVDEYLEGLQKGLRSVYASNEARAKAFVASRYDLASERIVPATEDSPEHIVYTARREHPTELRISVEEIEVYVEDGPPEHRYMRALSCGLRFPGGGLRPSWSEIAGTMNRANDF